MRPRIHGPDDNARLADLCRIAALTTTCRRKSLPKLRTCILDTLGCCLFGATLPPVRMVAAMAAEEGSGPAALFGLPRSTAAAQAALVNGTSAHAFQLDEIHLEATLHPGSDGTARRVCARHRHPHPAPAAH